MNFKYFNNCTYNENKDDPAKVVTKIWSSQQKITKLINFALIIDAGKWFSFDKNDMEYFKDHIAFLYKIKIKKYLANI